MNGWGKLGLWAGGVLFGTAGIAVLSSEDAKKLYTHVTAAAKRGGDCVMKTVTAIRENCEDISAAADDINEERARAKEEREIADARAKLEEYGAKQSAGADESAV
ncbi:DUF6110 family protein [Lachnoclostridium sp. Marseille-P6806]|uniref:DUF6110 family protein n=1 Tax=Lachnoclostridium sp. Marseille-P6806 TaxID=2364793 RepID=UPI0010323DC1|nr:DUF6110 family protein [Lachnoclostridium sp. Marseille-P6806]